MLMTPMIRQYEARAEEPACKLSITGKRTRFVACTVPSKNACWPRGDMEQKAAGPF
jgi:hypothetical protein